MSIGVEITKPDLDAMMTGLAGQLNEAFMKWKQVREFRDRVGIEGLQAMGYDATPNGDADQMFGIIGDLDQLRAIYQGEVNLTSPKNFQSQAARLYGFGFVV